MGHASTMRSVSRLHRCVTPVAGTKFRCRPIKSCTCSCTPPMQKRFLTPGQCVLLPCKQDLAKSLREAASYNMSEQQARLLFAHCETIIPFATLLGLFEPELPAPPSADMPSELGMMPYAFCGRCFKPMHGFQLLSLIWNCRMPFSRTSQLLIAVS